jgi:hypothetical protein
MPACKQEPSGGRYSITLMQKEMKTVDEWLELFHQLWGKRFNRLDEVLKQFKSKHHGNKHASTSR